MQADDPISFMQLTAKNEMTSKEDQFQLSLLAAMGNTQRKEAADPLASKLNKVQACRNLRERQSLVVNVISPLRYRIRMYFLLLLFPHCYTYNSDLRVKSSEDNSFAVNIIQFTKSDESFLSPCYAGGALHK